MSRLLLLSLLVAPRMSAQTARDSAGIRIVENPALADSPVRFRLGTQPTLDVGGLDADPELEFNAQRGE